MIDIRGLSAGYDETPVLKDLSLSLAPGQVAVLIGPNGCGKSTLLRAMLGLLPARSGEILLEGQPLSSLSRTEIARQIAWLPQGRTPSDMTVEQLVLHGRFPHLSYPRRYSPRDQALAREAIARMGLESKAHLPLKQLSGGMQQNAAIAMALCQDTPWILLDEPTTYLDITHQMQLMRTLRSLAAQGKGIVAVLHDLPLSFTWGDDIVLLEGGTLRLHGSPAELADSPLLQHIFGAALMPVPGGRGYCYRFDDM